MLLGGEKGDGDGERDEPTERPATEAVIITRDGSAIVPLFSRRGVNLFCLLVQSPLCENVKKHLSRFQL